MASWLNKGHKVKKTILLNSLATSLWKEAQREQVGGVMPKYGHISNS